MTNIEEKQYQLLHLPPGPVHLTDDVSNAVARFEPLEYQAAEKAITWLQVNLEAHRLPLDTYLVFSEDGQELYGFIVLELIDICIASGDVPIIQLRKKLADPIAPQAALKLVWIARSKASPKGFGQELFDEALALALEADACALLVEPYDEDTAKRVWLDHFELRTPRQDQNDPQQWIYLWHAVRPYEATWP